MLSVGGLVVTNNILIMADQKQEAPKFNFNKAAVETKLKLIESNMDKFVGKKGYNPFLWFQRKGIPSLKDRLAKGEATAELEKEILSLPDEPQPVTSTEPEPTYKEIIKPAPPSQRK